MTMRHVLLLAAPIYYREDDGDQRNSTWSFTFFVVKVSPWARKFSSSTADSILYKSDKQNTKETAELCQDQAGQFFRRTREVPLHTLCAKHAMIGILQTPDSYMQGILKDTGV